MKQAIAVMALAAGVMFSQAPDEHASVRRIYQRIQAHPPAARMQPYKVTILEAGSRSHLGRVSSVHVRQSGR
jgi:hypothetical protein